MAVLTLSTAPHSSVAAAPSLFLIFIREARLCGKDGHFISM